MLSLKTKSRWYEEGEKGTRYFYNLEKARYNARTCQTLLINDKEITEEDQILEHLREFYQVLYKKGCTDFTLKNTTQLKTPLEMKKRHGQVSTIDEIDAAVKFYLTFWDTLRKPFQHMMEYSYKQKLIHGTAREGVLNLIPKQDKDTRIPKNLRPITLLNTDYKIIEKCVANRLMAVAEEVIHMDQKGFMPGRRITANIRKLIDLEFICTKNEETGIILDLDIEKAFDRLSFEAIFGCMEYFDVAPYLIEWVRILYSDF